MTADDLARWEDRPVPRRYPETERFWRAASEGTLLVSRCRECGLAFYYPRPHCPDCFAGDADWIEVAGTGTLYAFSVAERVEGWPDDHPPVVVAYVELDEGPRVLTNVEDVDPAGLAIGDSLTVRFVPTDDPDVSVPVFVPASK